jgi:cobaltochelatase CobT
VRGHADAIARLACHDERHRKLVPGGQQARAVFDAIEQARVEAISARRMAGVAKNLSAMIDDRFHRGKFDEEVSDRARAARALAMRCASASPAWRAAGNKRVVELWRR